jgi:hypothetical protein
MSVALYIVLEKEIPEFDSYVNGKPPADAEPELARIAAELGLQPLMDFFSADPAEFLDEEELDSFELPPAPIVWHEASEGLRTIEGLLDYLRQHPQILPNRARVIADLEGFVRVLKMAEQHRVRWYLCIDI